MDSHIYFNLYRPLYTLAWGHYITWYTGWNCSTCFSRAWDCHVWCNSYQTVATDCGSSFELSLFTYLTQHMGIQCCRTTAYHPHANSLDERFHRKHKSYLKSLYINTLFFYLFTWLTFSCQRGLITYSTVAEILFGTTLRLPGQFFDSPIQLDSFSTAD